MKPDKSKAICILLAIFFGFWTWLYTYKIDAKKFWIGIILNFVVFALYFLGLTFYGLFVLLLVVNIFIAIWAVVDSIIKKDKILEKYWSIK